MNELEEVECEAKKGTWLRLDLPCLSQVPLHVAIISSRFTHPIAARVFCMLKNGKGSGGVDDDTCACERAM